MLFYYVSSHFFVIVELVNSELGLTRFILCKAIPVLVAEVSMPTHCATSAGGNPQKRRRCWKPCVTLWNPVPQKCSTGHLEVYFPGFSTWQCDCSIRCVAVNSIRQKRNIALHSFVLCVYISILTTSTLREPKNSSLIAIGPDAKSMGFLEKEVPEVFNGSVICRPRGFFESTWMIHQLEAALLFQCFLNDNYSFSCAHW